ncbi:MAG: 2-C-methyl-D-erythritol 2,4-cyclodiphosphate synthase [Clostridiales bacterium]|jgi:2-C-methyl-D-erythritol 2,4-cyclodiphosphate synthase|nr:2-C-methyl-D-erythritol 2,4-cyclodiphosphate synthase [Clostridiales bacterium]
MRVGQGYDVHRLVKGRPLILGGVNIPYPKGLDGHSDADALIHAVMDALLGAAGLGDIGQNFPDSDSRFAGISSILLLRETHRLITEAGWETVNIDATVVAQRPKLAGYKKQMADNIARALETDAANVNVKATTEEGLGFTGTGRAVSAHAVCLLKHI